MKLYEAWNAVQEGQQGERAWDAGIIVIYQYLQSRAFRGSVSKAVLRACGSRPNETDVDVGLTKLLDKLFTTTAAKWGTFGNMLVAKDDRAIRRYLITAGRNFVISVYRKKQLPKPPSGRGAKTTATGGTRKKSEKAFAHLIDLDAKGATLSAEKIREIEDSRKAVVSATESANVVRNAFESLGKEFLSEKSTDIREEIVPADVRLLRGEIEYQPLVCAMMNKASYELLTETERNCIYGRFKNSRRAFEEWALELDQRFEDEYREAAELLPDLLRSLFQTLKSHHLNATDKKTSEQCEADDALWDRIVDASETGQFVLYCLTLLRRARTFT